jgi:hypothetical protein
VAIRIVIVEHAAQPSYPARCPGDLAAVSKVKDEPENTTRGLVGKTLFEIAAMSPVQQADGLLIVTEHMRGNGAALKLLRT